MTNDGTGAPPSRALQDLAAAAACDLLAGGCDGADPILSALYDEARQFMHGACGLLALHLHETRGLSVVLVEGAPPAGDWICRHAMVCTCSDEEAASLIRDGRGLEVPVLDAAGAGSAGDRLPLFVEAGWTYRMVLAADPRCASSWMWESGPKRSCDIEHLVRRLPALCFALRIPFDLRAVLLDLRAGASQSPASTPRF